MARNLIVLSDGTGNSAASTEKTNVWRLYQALDLTGPDQIATFADGVGTSSFKPLKVLGLALGVGVKHNVLELYKFLCRNYCDGDRIYGFGFSRGAYTIRLLTGLVEHEGLVPYVDEVDLKRNAAAAYRSFRRKAFKVTPFNLLIWTLHFLFEHVDRLWAAIWQTFTGVMPYHQVAQRSRTNIPIHFLGLWDTVSAYGLPIKELTDAVDKWLFPMSFRDTSLLPSVKCARHALSIDDERHTFHPIPWDESKLPPRTPNQPLAGLDLVQVWFAGVHANVGGGYPDDSLAYVPLCWMIEEAKARGLQFMDILVEEYRAFASELGPLYDPRDGLGTIYRYKPRSLDALMNEATDRRKRRHALAKCFLDWRPVRALLDTGWMAWLKDSALVKAILDDSAPRRVKPLVDGSVFRRMVLGNDRYAPLALDCPVDVRTAGNLSMPFNPPTPLPAPLAGHPQDLRLVASLNTLEKPSLDLAGDLVWWRRCNYFLTLGLLLVLALFPWLDTGLSAMASELAKGSIVSDKESADAFAWLVGWLMDLIGGTLPDWAAPWVLSFRESPNTAAVLILAIAALLTHSSYLQRRIRDEVRLGWGLGSPHQRPDRIRSAIIRATLAGALAFVLVAKDSPLGVFVGLLALSQLGWAIFATGNGREAATPIGRVRSSCLLNWFVGLMARWVFPTGAILAVFAGVLLLLNHVVYDLVNAAKGPGCESNADSSKLAAGERRAVGEFATASFCWATHVLLEEGVRYRIWLEIPQGGEWWDESVDTDIGGFAAEAIVHRVAIPLRRWVAENYFQPIARIGKTGNDEYVLAPLEKLPPRDDGMRRRLVSEVKARTDGELFLYVNDAILAVPGRADMFYGNNKGTANVTVERIAVPDWPAPKAPAADTAAPSP